MHRIFAFRGSAPARRGRSVWARHRRPAPARILLLAAALLATLAGTAEAAPPAAPLILHPQRLSASAQRVPGSFSNGYSPEQIRNAYRLPAVGARNQTVAIIAAYNDPYIAADLAAYDRNFGLPACTVASGCLSIRNETGARGPLPPTDPTGQTWLTETSLGTEAVHGICESCKIVIYEANVPESPDLSAAVNAAAQAGATEVVTTFEPVESASDSTYALDYSHQRTAIISATGEALNSTYGYGGDINFPSSLNFVTATGGTTLHLARNGQYGSEAAWTDTVSGCSLFSVAAPWQVADAQTVGCGEYRAVADLSADSNPGMLIYASHLSIPGGPWFQATGTSVSAPIIAAEIGLAGSLGSAETQDLYAHVKADPAVVHDITQGKTSSNCTTRQCEAAKGFDGPTGLGTPYGLGAFLANGGALAPGTPNVKIANPYTTVGHNWQLYVGVNDNLAIAIRGTLYARVRIGRRTFTLATHTLTMNPLGHEPVRLSIPAYARRALAHRRVSLTIELTVHGVGGRTATLSARQTVSFVA